MDNLPVEVFDVIAGFLRGIDLFRFSVCCSCVQLSERAWKAACLREFGRSSRFDERFSYSPLWRDRFRACLRACHANLTQAFKSEMLVAGTSSSAGLAHADLCSALLRERSFGCGVDYCLWAVNFAGCVNFVCNECLRGGIRTHEYGAALVALLCCPDEKMDILDECEKQIQALVEEFGKAGPLPRDRVDAVVSVMNFLKLRIQPAESQCYYETQNSLLHCVLSPSHGRGIPITMAVVVSAVCRRVGVELDLLNTSGHLLCRIRNTEIFVDCFFGLVGTWNEVTVQQPQISENQKDRVMSPTEVMLRMCNNLYHTEYQGIRFGQFPPFNRTFLALSCAVPCLTLELDLLRAVLTVRQDELLIHIRNCVASKIGVPVMNMEDVTLRKDVFRTDRPVVGAFVLYGRNCDRAVVCGVKSNHLVLCVEQEEVEFMSPLDQVDEVVVVEGPQHPLNSRLIGKYFARFEDGKYIPNRQTREMYPQDFLQ